MKYHSMESFWRTINVIFVVKQFEQSTSEGASKWLNEHDKNQ